jgi:hypothetical protein
MSVLEVSLAKQLATETVHGQFRWVSLNSHWVAFGCRSSKILELSSVGSQERTSDSPCHVVLIDLGDCFPQIRSGNSKEMISFSTKKVSPLCKGGWFGY